MKPHQHAEIQYEILKYNTLQYTKFHVPKFYNNCEDRALCSTKAPKVDNPYHNLYAHVLLEEHNHNTK